VAVPRRLVLVVGVDVGATREATALAARHGYDVLVADSLAAARAALVARDVAVLVLDGSPRSAGGVAFLRELRAQPRHEKLPVLLMGDGVLGSPELLADDVTVYLSRRLDDGALGEAIDEALLRTAGHDVLLVDDDEGLLTVVARQLEQAGISVRRASTVAEAVKAARASAPGLLVLDVGLPDGSGYDVVQALSADPRLAAIPLLVFTGHELDAEQRRRLRLGATRFLTKTRTDEAEFQSVVQELLEVGAERRAA
jgi:DNA-binding response OmpR family regulator